MWPERRGICFPALPDRGELLTEHALLFQKSPSSEVRQHRSQPKRKRQTCENNDCRIHARATLTMCGKPRFLISGVDNHQTRCAISRRLQNLVTTPEIKNRGFILPTRSHSIVISIVRSVVRVVAGTRVTTTIYTLSHSRSDRPYKK